MAALEEERVLLPLAAPRPRFEAKGLVIGAALLLLAWLVLVPLLFLLWQSVTTPPTLRAPAILTLRHFERAYGSFETLRLFANSLIFAIGASLVAFVIGTALAWLNERTNTPLKKLFFGLAVVPLVIPSILFTVSWLLLASPKIGLLNLLAQHWFGLDGPWLNVYSMTGMILVDGLHYSPMAFLLMSAAFRAMDPALEEAAMVGGAGLFRVLHRVTLRLARPAILGTLFLLFVRCMESFEVPALLGMPAGIRVFTSAIYEAIHRFPSQVGLGAAYGVTLLLLTALGIFLQSRLFSRAHQFTTVTGKGFRPRLVDLGRWRYVAAAFFILYLLLIVGLPFAVLLWCSLQRFYSVPSAESLGALTLDTYRFVLSHPTLGRAVWNSLLVSIGSATLVMGLCAVLCWLTVKTRLPGRWLIDSLASLPLVFPGLVLGLALMVFYLNVDIGVYGTLWILLIAYVTRFLPYGMRYGSHSMVQIHHELEEAGALSGAGWARVFRRILLPLLKPGLLAGWIYILLVSIRELSSSLLLYSPGTEVVSVVIWELWVGGQYTELSALGVLMIAALFLLVQLAQAAGARFGVRDA